MKRDRLAEAKKRLVTARTKADFAEALEEVLQDNVEALPLGQGCRAGGWPDLEWLQFEEIKKTYSDRNSITATFTVCFTENVNTSCGDCVVTFNRSVDCRVEIEKDTGDCSVTYIESNYYPEEF